MEHYFTSNENLKSEIIKINYSYNEYDFTFFSDNGVFSKKHIDYGSKLLLETFLENNNHSLKVLDIGCGYGFIGICISKILDSNVTMVDVNKRALHLTNMNIEKNGVSSNALLSNAYENIDDKYDVIITNPPVRAGKKVLIDILDNAKDYLNKGGALWFVLRKDQGAKSMKELLNKHYNVDIIKKSKGFYVFCSKPIDKNSDYPL